MKRWQTLRSRLQLLHWDQKALILAGLLAASPLFFPVGSQYRMDPNRTEDSGADTHIPAGFVLIPIEISNYEALDSILGSYGIVDLFSGGSSPESLVARNVRLLRAPKNPSHFAVLVPEQEAPRILRLAGPFLVSLKRRSSDGTEFVKSNPRPRRKVIYERD